MTALARGAAATAILCGHWTGRRREKTRARSNCAGVIIAAPCPSLVAPSRKLVPETLTRPLTTDLESRIGRGGLLARHPHHGTRQCVHTPCCGRGMIGFARDCNPGRETATGRRLKPGTPSASRSNGTESPHRHSRRVHQISIKKQRRHQTLTTRATGLGST